MSEELYYIVRTCVKMNSSWFHKDEHHHTTQPSSVHPHNPTRIQGSAKYSGTIFLFSFPSFDRKVSLSC